MISIGFAKRAEDARRNKGQACLPLIFTALFVVAGIGMFGFEVARTTVVRNQLRTATESAALAGIAALSGSSSLDPATSQNHAMSAARSVFEKNDVLGQMLTHVETDFAATPAQDHVKVEMRFLNPKANNAPVPVGDPNGKVLEVRAKYGMTPMLASFIGMERQVLPLEAEARGGVGDLDVALCFDVSGSMDDQTQMTHVRRRWDAGSNRVVYEKVNEGKLALGPGAVRPQALEYASLNADLRGPAEAGTPPGNYPPGAATLEGMTDAVVNIDENRSFAGTTIDGFAFPNVAVLVEAARGNLENGTVFAASKADSGEAAVVSPRAGYQAKYFELAAKHTHPLAEAKEAAKDFFQLMNKNANTHFGLVAFDNLVGENLTTGYDAPNVASTFAPGGNSRFPVPGVALVADEATTNFDTVNGQIDRFVAYNATNIGGATERAIRMFDSGSRRNARKAIIVFTDGEPTVGGPLSGNPEQNCRMAAQLARTKGISVYTVGLAQTAADLPGQREVLGDDVPSGMAFIAGNGSKFFPVTSSAGLRNAFASIARHLSQLVQ